MSFPPNTLFLQPNQVYVHSVTGIPAFTIDSSCIAIGFYRGANIVFNRTENNAIGFKTDIELVSATSLIANLTNIGSQMVLMNRFFLSVIWYSKS